MSLNSSLASSINNSSISITSLIFFFTLFSLFSPSLSSNPPDAFRDLVVEEKTRLGSTPPSCHNKCNQCHPCMAVQVPSLPSHGRINPAAAAAVKVKHPMDFFDSSGNRYSNYKPLGWKCRCDGHFFNP